MNIKQFRKAQRITQEELAERIGVHENTIRLWEKGMRDPRSSDIQKLCEVLHCTEAELLNGQSVQDWNLRLITPKEEPLMVGTIDLTGRKAKASLEMSDTGMGLTLSGSYELWEDDDKFEDLLNQIRRKRATALRVRKEEW